MSDEKKCDICKEPWPDNRLICAGSAEPVNECSVHPGGKCPEPICIACWDEE